MRELRKFRRSYIGVNIEVLSGEEAAAWSSLFCVWERGRINDLTRIYEVIYRQVKDAVFNVCLNA
jgi:hypothetical protein